MDYQTFVNTVGMPCCVMSVKKTPEGTCGEIRILCSNQMYKDVMGPAYYDNMIYSELVPKDNKFEDFCFRSAVMGQRLHAYVETRALGTWTDQTLVPLASDEEDTGYCQFLFEFTKAPDPERLASVSLTNTSNALAACVRLNASGKFEDKVGDVLEDVLKVSEAWGCRIMLLDKEREETIIFAERYREGVWPERHDGDDVISYELIRTWEEAIGVSNELIVTNEEEMSELEKRNPQWVESMRSVGVTSLVLSPLKREQEVNGYLYVVNINLEKLVEIKELLELLSYFLGAEISNYLLMRRLDMISHIDALTGLNNRHAMLRHMKRFKESGRTCSFGVINLDLNGLKKVNDTEGHEAGDRLLIQAGKILRKVFDEDDIYRTGGDEFIVISEDISRETFERRVERLKTDVEKNADVSFASGAFWSDGSVDMESAFRYADAQMYADKRAYYEIHVQSKRADAWIG